MYNKEEAIREQIKAEKKAVFLFFGLLLVLAGFVALTVSKLEDNKIYYGIYVVALFFIVKYTRMHCFLLPRRRYGTVASMSDFEEKHSITNPGTYARRTGQYTKMNFTLEVRFENGKNKYFEFEYTGAVKNLKVGDSVGIYRFLKMPVHIQ